MSESDTDFEIKGLKEVIKCLKCLIEASRQEDKRLYSILLNSKENELWEVEDNARQENDRKLLPGHNDSN